MYQADASLVDIDVGKVPVGIHKTELFAWWVADEGMKAKFNSVDSGIDNADTDATLDKDKFVLMQARQSNFTHVSATGSDKFSSAFHKNFTELRADGGLSKVYDSQSLALLSSGSMGQLMLPKDPAGARMSATVNRM